MRDSSIRDVTFLDIIITSDPPHAPEREMLYFINKFEELRKISQTTRWNRNKTQKWFLRDIEINISDDYAILLIDYNNGNASAASYSHLDTDVQRIVPPHDREGRPETVHLLIKLTSTNTGQHRHLALLEDSTKINRAVVKSYLNFLLKEVCKANQSDFLTPHPDGSIDKNGKPRFIKYINKVDVQGHPSSEFLLMLQNGKLTGIALESGTHDQFSVGDGTYVHPTRREIRLSPTSGKWSEHPIERFKEALTLGRKNGYEEARITFLAADQRSNTVRVNTQTQNMIGDSFIERKRLSNFSKLLSDSETSINPEIKQKMIDIFK